MSGMSGVRRQGNAERTVGKTGEDFLIVGIGASAGGIQALKEFFQNVPADSGMAYVVILHLSPDHESILAEILQTVAPIPVAQVRDESVKVKPNHVYVIPPNKSLAMNDGHLALSPIESYEERRAPVDIFFRTLAESNESRAVSVILSGTGADGSMGMKRVKEKGGIVIVQDPREAEYDDMPKNSLAAGLVDYVLPVREIPAQIIAYRDHLRSVRIAVAPEDPRRDESDETALRAIFTQLRVKTGHDFTNYKRATVLRRVERRIGVRELTNLPAYARLMREQPEEAQILLKDLLISVTNFFRDRAAFEAVGQNVLPKIFSGKTAQDQVRIWVAGCATGEEAYSMAMLCCERTENAADAPAVQIFATDIDEQAVTSARDGFYTNADVADVSPDRLRKFFVREGVGFRVRRELRDMILFARHNVIKDPPFSHLDLATCRNLLIYLNRAAQARVMETFHFALNPGGYLFLGSSESVEGGGDLYATIDRENCIFQSRALASRPVPPVPEIPLTMRSDVRREPPPTPETRAIERMSLAALHQQLLEVYAPPSILVNGDYDIVHLSERAGRYLQIGGGEPSYNLLKVVRPELRLELRGALYQAVQNRQIVKANEIPVRVDESDEAVNITVRPVWGENEAARGFLMVLFERTEIDGERAALAEPTDSAAEPVAARLEAELVRVKAQLRSTTEQYEVQAEELKASNEELQAINEELRSAAEELETGKEELQSVNEELTTVNQELKIKIEELSQSNSDFQNLMNSTDIGTVFLDRAFRVNLFTPAAREIFNLIPTDYGRPLSDITHRLADADLLRDAELVLQKLHAVEREVGTEDGRTFLMRISPYRTADDHINGIVLTFLDVTERKRREEETRQLANRVGQQARLFDTTLTSISDFVYIFDRDGRFVYSNLPLLDLLGITSEEITGKNFFDLNYPPDLAARLQKQIQQVFERAEIVRDETPFTSPEGKPGFYEYIFTPVFAADGTVESVAGSTRDVTERKRIETQLRENREHLQRALNAGRIFSWEMNPATRELEWSSNTQNVIGFPLLDNIDKTFELIHPDDIKPTVDAINKAIETGGDYESEYRLVNPANGEAFWFHSQGAITTNTADGQPRFVGITQNITERKETEEQLRESEERFRVLISKGADMITVSDREGKIIYASPTTERVSGYPPEEFAQQHPFDLIHPEDRPRCEEALNELVGTPGVSLDLQHRVRHKDGTWRWVEGTFTSLYNDPAVGGLVANVRDITARKKTEEALRSSEERSRLTMESVTDYAILTTDAEGHIETWNVGAECVFGYTEAEVIGQPSAIIFTPEDRAKGEPEKEMREAREAGRAADERWHVRKDDSRFYVSGVLVPLLDEGGAVIGYAKIARDLTEQRRAEEALRRAHDELESRVTERTSELQEVNESLVEEVRDRLAAEGRARGLVRKIVTAQEEERKRVARDLHDQLGQQLTALQLKLETHRTRLADDEASRAQVEEIQTIARQIDNEVDFLAWELRPASLDDLGLPAALQNFIEEWSKHVGTPAKFHTTGFVSEADRLPPEIEINFYRIAQEALNNIYKHAEAGGVDVIFERRADQVVLIVEDDGKGFNLRTAVGSKDRGIGLLNMRERASFVGGTLEIESRKGVGTTLFVRVPLPPVENGR